MKRSPNSGRVNLVPSAALVAVLLYVAWLSLGHVKNKPNIKVGVLHSLICTMAASETPPVKTILAQQECT